MSEPITITVLDANGHSEVNKESWLEADSYLREAIADRRWVTMGDRVLKSEADLDSIDGYNGEDIMVTDAIYGG